MIEAFLFIGGPLDGESRAIPDGYLKSKVPVLGPAGTAASGPLACTGTTYRRERLCGQDERALQRTFDIFIIEGMSTAEAMEKLIEHYRPGDDSDA